MGNLSWISSSVSSPNRMPRLRRPPAQAAGAGLSDLVQVTVEVDVVVVVDVIVGLKNLGSNTLKLLKL